MRVAVVGGTGTVGMYVVRALAGAGHEPVVVARSRGVDVVSGTGLDAALAGAGAVVDVGNTTTNRRKPALRYFEQATRTVTAAADRAGVRHLVVLSIVGVDRVPGSGYYAAKVRQEEMALAGPVAATVLRTTQFHEFAGQVLARTRLGPVALVPQLRLQPVAAATVGAALAGLAAAPPAGRVPDLAGPEPADLLSLTRRLVAHRGDKVRLLPLRLPGAAGTAMRTGALLPGPGARLAGPTFQEWLQAQEQRQP